MTGFLVLKQQNPAPLHTAPKYKLPENWDVLSPKVRIPTVS